MTKKHLLNMAFLIIGLSVFGYIWSALYYALIGFDYNSALPWSALQVYIRFSAHPDISEKFMISLGVTAGAFICITIFWFSSKPKSFFGDARWASRKETKQASLFGDQGLMLGIIGNNYVRSNEPTHALVAAPTRAGKGVGIVIPNLLSWTGSAIVLDIKLENFERTSGYRARSQKVFMFAPNDESGHSHRFNPLDTIRDTDLHRISDVQRLASILLPSEKSETSMWTEEARDLFIGLVLYVLDVPEIPATIGAIYRTLKTEDSLSDVLEHILEHHKDNLTPACVMSFNNFINKASKEQSGVKSSLSATLNLWSLPSIDAATSASDFNIENLRREKTTIYFGAGLNQLKPLSRLIRLFFELSVDVLTRALPQEDEPHQVLMLIDEFGSLGRMPVIADNLAFVAGYNIRMVNIIQGLGQLDILYGNAGRENILQNSALQVFFASNDETTTGYVARRFGDKTIQTESISFGQGTLFGNKSHSYAKTEFMRPDVFRRFCKKHLVMFKEGARPIKAKKIIYYKNKAMTERLLPPASVPLLPIEDKEAQKFDIKKKTKENPTEKHRDFINEIER